MNLNMKLRNNRLNISEEFNINPMKFKHISKTPLSKAYNIISKIYNPNEKIFKNRQYDIMKPPPTYVTEYPTNIRIEFESQLILR